MDNRLTALARFLEALGVDSSIDTLDDRKRVQKAVYLGQLSGVDLGYSYGWYLRGPYSPDLTRDYYHLAEEVAVNEAAVGEKSLRREVVERLEQIRPMLLKPSEFPRELSQEDWLELAASYHFLRSVSRYTDQQTVAVLQERKPTLAPYAGVARRVLEQYGLLAEA